MQDDENTCHDLGAEMELPDGVFPPMSGYTHEDLSAVARSLPRLSWKDRALTLA